MRRLIPDADSEYEELSENGSDSKQNLEDNEDGADKQVFIKERMV